MYPPENPSQVPHFINRSNYLRNFDTLLQNTSLIEVIADTFGTYGTGKTTMLSHLYQRVREKHELHPIWLSLNLFSMYHRNPQLSENTQSLDTLVENFVSYHELLAILCRAELPSMDLESHIRQTSLEILDMVGSIEVDLEGSVEQWQKALGAIKASDHASTTEYKRAIEQAVVEITDIFLLPYNRQHQDKKAVLFADDYCWVSDQPLGNWIIDNLAERMNNTILVVSRTTEKTPGDPNIIYPLYLTNFTPEDVAIYLEKRLGKTTLYENPHIVESVYQFTAGHAQTVSFATDLLQYGVQGVDIDLPTFDITQGDQANTMRLLVRRMLNSTEENWLREALQMGALLRRFDGILMHELLQDTFPENNDITPEDILRRLQLYSFVDYYHDDRSTPYFAFHSFVADRIQEVIQEDDAKRQQADPDAEPLFTVLHANIADYYYKQLEDYQADDGDTSEDVDTPLTVVQLYRYEDPIWQQTMSEWLYHIAFVEDREQAQIEFCNQYFEAFQWWGFYLKFPYCEHLLTQWQSTQHDEDARIVELLWRFHEAYPLGYSDEKRGAEGWGIVQPTLEAIDSYFGGLIDSDTENLDETRRALRINLLEMYASCFRFRSNPDYDRAIKLYKKVTDLSQENDDLFHASYGLTYRAEMYIEMGNYREAELKALESNEEFGDYRPFNPEHDYEVMSLNYRILGDVALSRGEINHAGQYYLDSSLCAYAFHFVQEDIPPDPYTVKWNADTARWIVQQLLTLVDNDQTTQAVQMSQHLRDGWAWFREEMMLNDDINLEAMLEDRNANALTIALFPPSIDLKSPELKSPLYMERMVRIVVSLLQPTD